ncbi:hypothetical protein BH23ACT7_BH23ACT7_00620 [soil metagenome]
MADVDVMSSLQRLQQQQPAGTQLPFLDPITGPEAQPDGAQLFRTAIDLSQAGGSAIPIGSWKLRVTDAGGQPKLPVRVLFESQTAPAPGLFRSLEVDASRFELEADPRDLVAADLVADPYTHLVANPALGPVKLIGPGFTLVLRGAGLTDFGARFNGANGSSDPRFPSARFEPPHFQIAGTDIGIACDEVLVDLSEDIDPENLEVLTGAGGDGSFKGLLLQELGIFVGDPEDVGTWSGMARVRDFVLRFEPFEVTGTFEGELVHAVPPDDPQVAVEVSWVTDSGQRVAVEEVGPMIPAPVAPTTARRVRLVATPNWASIGFQVTWTAPETVQVEDPTKLRSPDLGWVLVPPGSHSFTVDVTDHRVDPVSATRAVIVQAPPAPTPGPKPLDLTLSASVGEPAGGARAVHLFLPARPLQPVDVVLAATGGAEDSMVAHVELPAGWQTGEVTKFASRAPGGLAFPAVGFLLTTAAQPGEATVVASVRVGTETVERRLRVQVRPAHAPGTPELELLTYTDWRPDDGVGAALAFAHDGLAYDTPVWKLGSLPADPALLSGDAHDHLFGEASTDWAGEATIGLATTGGLVKPDLSGPDRLFRLLADVPAVPATAADPAVVFPETVSLPAPGGSGPAPTLPADQLQVFTDPRSPVADVLPEGPRTFARPGGEPASPILFAWAEDRVPPESAHPEHDAPRTTQEITTAQTQGFADLFRAVLDAGDRLAEVHVFGSASVEGDEAYNLDLSQRRLDAALLQLRAPDQGLRDRIALLPPPHRLAAQEITDAAARLAALPVGAVKTRAVGERFGSAHVDPFDRRVFAVLKLADTAAVPEFQRRAFFLVRGGAPITPTPDRPPLPRPQQHPFRHSVFRSAHLEVELRRNELVRLQFRLELDLERFDENELDPAGSLNPNDGIVTGFLELRRDPDPAASPRYRWELDLLADPQDADGLVAYVLGGTGDALVRTVGGPLIALPALAAAAGGRTSQTGLVLALGIGVFLQQQRVFDVQTVVWKGLRLRLEHGSAGVNRFSFAFDYGLTYHIDVDLTPFGLPLRMQTTTPIAIAFRNVGIDLVAGGAGVQLFYDPASGFAVDIADPGVFQLGEGLGRLLRVDRVSSGAGSPLWLEVELGFALDVGVFEVDTLRIRLSLEGERLFEPDATGEVFLDERAIDLDDLEVTINKLGVSVDVPGVLGGSGVLGIRDEPGGGTTVEGALALDFEALPVLRGLEGRMRLFERDDLRALFLALGVDFSPGLALGSTGMAVYGLHGVLGSNMAPSNPVPLDWLRQPPVGSVTSEQKWAPARGSWAFGAGATLATVFDGGFVFNLSGTLLLLIPGPRFVLAAHAQVFSPRPDVGEVQGVLASVLLDLEHDLVTVGFDLTRRLENLVELHVPAEAFFNLADASDFHLRLGQWLPEEQRISLRVFELFDAWGYVQVEGNGLHNGALDLDGIAVGAGARIEITWGRKRVLYLEAFAEAHAGIQLAPLYFEGLVVVGGSLHVGPLSIGAHGELAAKARVTPPRFLVLRGKVCGSIDLWFTSITKCATFELGDGDSPTPPPENPFIEAVAVDRTSGLPIGEVDGEVIVPLDAVFHLTFGADIADGRTPAGLFAAHPRNQMSTELFYEFTLASLDLRRIGGAAVTPATSAWAPYTLVAAGSTPPSQRTLRVLDWKPAAHPRQVDFATATASSLTTLVQSLCDPLLPLERRCADFDEEPLGHRSVWLLDHGLAPVQVIGRPAGLGAEAQAADGELQPPRVVPLVAADYPNRGPQDHCLHLGNPDPERVVPLLDLLAGLPLSPKAEGVRAAVLPVLEAADAAPSGTPLPPELLRLRDAGVVVAGLPSLVALDVVVATPRRFHGDAGEALLLNAALQPVAGPFELGTLPALPGGTTGGTIVGHVVRVLAFGDAQAPPAEPPPAARWLLLRPPALPEVRVGLDEGSFLLELCGVTLADWLERTRAHTDRQHTISLLTTLSGLVAGEPALFGEPLLEPGADYGLIGTLDWERFRSADALDADGSSASEGGPLEVRSRRFRADPNPPADLTRFVRDHDPFNADQPHYTDEPLLIRYASAAVDRMYAAYGRQLVIRAKADTGGHVVIQPTSAGAGVTFTPLGAVEQELFEALEAMTGACLPGNWLSLFPYPLHAVSEPLLANTSYTVSIQARPQSEPGGLDFDAWAALLEADFEAGAFVYRFDLRTSRFATFADHVAAYRATPVGDLFVDDPPGLAAAVAATPPGAPLRSDEAVDTLSLAAVGGPMLIPAAPEVLRLWVPQGAGWRCVGLVLDGPEPLLGRRLRADGGLEDRVLLELRSAAHPAVPFGQGQPLPGVRVAAGARGARVLAFFEPPGGLAPGAVLLRLHDRGQGTSTAPGADHTIGVPVGDTPAVLTEEGA